MNRQSLIRLFAFVLFGCVIPAANAQNPQNLEQALLNYSWEWTHAPRPPDLLTFRKDGMAVCPRFSWHWKITGPRTVLAYDAIDSGRPAPNFQATLEFDESFSSLTAQTPGGKFRYTGRRLAAAGPSSAALSTPSGPDFVPLLDTAHLGGWTWGNDMVMKDGAWQTFGNRRRGINYYTGQTFGDFIVRLEFKADEGTSNSGVFLRASPTDPKKGYEVQIYGLNGPDEPTGSFYSVKKATLKAQKSPGQWNEMEITAIGQKYTVRLNGQVINELTGDRELTGNLGLQSHNKGPVQIRNVMIKDLSQPAPVAPAAPAVLGLAAKPDDTTVDILSQQAPNAIEWALSPLDQGVPGDIRQNLTFLREDLLDESTNPKASPDAYKLGAQLCNTLLAVLQERSQTAGRAGFRAVEANARTGVSSQALDARRNYKMSWPQFAREESQRAELKSQAQNNAEVMKERPKLEWLQRSQQLRPGLDTAYAQFRAALRQPAPAKP